MASRFVLETVFKGKDYVSKVLDKQIRKQRKLNSLESRRARQLQANATLQRASRNGLVAMGAAAVGAAAGVWKLTQAGRDFDSEMSKVQAAMGKLTWDEDMSALREEAARLGATTEFTSAQAASGMVELAKAGFTAQQSIGAVGSVLAGASAGELEMADAAAILTSTMAGLGLKSDDMAENTLQAKRVMDVLALASTKTKSSIATIGESMKSISPVAKMFNISLEDSVAMAAKMQDVGIDASEAGNSIKTMFTKLTKPSKAAADMMKKAGVSFVDSFGKMKPPKEFFAEALKLQDSFEGNADAVAAFAELAGLRGMKPLMVLAETFGATNKQGQTFTDMLKEAGGAAEQMAKTKLDNLNGDVTKMGSAFDGLRVALNDNLKGALRPMIQEFTAWLSDPATKEDIVSIVNTFKEWAPALWTITKILGLVLGSIFLVTTATTVWTAAVGILTALINANPISIAFMAIVAAIMLVIYYWDEFKIAFMMGIDAMLAPAKLLYNTVVGIANALGASMEYANLLSFTEGEMGRQEEAENQAARQRAASAQSGKQGGGTTTVDGQIGVTVKGPATVTATSKGPVGLALPASGGV